MATLAIGKVANLFGVTPQTIRNWSKRGLLKSKRTLGGHRRYQEEEVRCMCGLESQETREKATIIYSRVSGGDQKEDLQRQTEELKHYCQAQNMGAVEVIEDIGSGIAYNKRGLKKLIKKVILVK